VPAPALLFVLFGLQIISGLCIAAGRGVRPALGVWFASFVFIELLDKSLYLNHYVLFSLVGLTLLLSPIGSLKWSHSERGAPQWLLWLLRIEFATVYFWAGVHKINADWLVRGEPLATWLQAHSELPWVGTFLTQESTALAMSWSGMIYDLTIPFLLLWSFTRPLALLLVFGFHAAVGLLFPIGMFPLMMMTGALLFCTPSWPRRYFSGVWNPNWTSEKPLSPLASWCWGLAVAVFCLFPSRSLWAEGNDNWREQSYRFSWKVLLNEKTGLVNYRVVDPESGQTWHVSPADELTLLQHQQMRTQPDMIRDYALHLKRRREQEIQQTVEVYVDSWASLNGRPSQRFIRPDLDISRTKSWLEAQDWIVPLQAFE